MVVLAAGYSTQQLAPDIGLNFPQIERPGVTILTPPMAPIFQTVACVHTPKDLPDPQMNFRQIHGGTHFGSVENETAVR
jgi:hypothetical protein